MRSAAVQNAGPGPLQKFRPPARETNILVAVSGGVDSMVLLHLLKALSVERRWKLTVAHFNHRLRGRASDADEVFVRKTAKGMKLPFVSKRADVKRFARESKLSIEMAARKLRHEFLAEVARACKIKTIALAHHADDQVELFFLRLLRGHDDLGARLDLLLGGADVLAERLGGGAEAGVGGIELVGEVGVLLVGCGELLLGRGEVVLQAVAPGQCADPDHHCYQDRCDECSRGGPLGYHWFRVTHVFSFVLRGRDFGDANLDGPAANSR